jgi:D-psicose/D-tagatose/L-ribulose 3-epimerase
MKIGMNLLLWTAYVTEAHFPLLASLKKAGYDGVELPLFDGDAAHYKKVRKELDNLGLGATTVTVVNADTNPIDPNPSVRAKALDRIKWAIDMTHELGGTALAGPYHSAIGVFSGNPPTEQEKAHGIEVLRKAADHAQQAKVTMTIEYLNRFVCYFLTTAAQAAELVDTVNHPSFKCMYDTFHAHIEEKNQSSPIAALGNRFAHVHISENDRGVPGTGQVHWDEAFTALKKSGYDGWLTIEAFGRALPDIAAATKVWRDLFAQPEDVYLQGIDFIKKKWNS